MVRRSDAPLKTERQSRITALVQSEKRVLVSELSRHLGVSEMTIRRDLCELEQSGVLVRDHGGAFASRSTTYEPPYIARSRENVEEKRSIGRLAATLLRENDMVVLDVGTTILEVARNLPTGLRLTVITHWLPMVEVLEKHDHVSVVVTGGVLRSGEKSLIGNMAISAFRRFFPGKVFLGVAGISLDKGLTDYTIDEVEIKKAMIECAKEVIVLADHTKLERVAPVPIGPISLVHTIVTDSGIAESQKSELQDAGVRLLVAD